MNPFRTRFVCRDCGKTVRTRARGLAEQGICKTCNISRFAAPAAAADPQPTPIEDQTPKAPADPPPIPPTTQAFMAAQDASKQDEVVTFLPKNLQTPQPPSVIPNPNEALQPPAGRSFEEVFVEALDKEAGHTMYFLGGRERVPLGGDQKGLVVSAPLDYTCMMECWMQELCGAQVERNGFTALGLGFLNYYAKFSAVPMALERQRGKLGHWNSAWWGDDWKGNIFDGLFVDRDGNFVVVEYKRKADEAVLVQAARYLGALRKRAKLEGRQKIHVVVVAFSMEESSIEAYRELRRGWSHFRVLLIRPIDGALRLQEAGSEHRP